MSSPKLAPARRRAYAAPPPRARVQRAIDIHPHDCDCEHCDPYAPSVVPALRGRDLAGLAAAGFAVATLIAAAIDRAGTAAIVADLIRWWFL